MARTYGKAFRTWYTNLMPAWRKPSGKKCWPLLRSAAPHPETWSAIRKRERNGVSLVLLGLAWWKAATSDGTVERDDYQSVVDDFGWVFPQVLGVSASTLPLSPSLDEQSREIVAPEQVAGRAADVSAGNEIALRARTRKSASNASASLEHA